MRSDLNAPDVSLAVRERQDGILCCHEKSQYSACAVGRNICSGCFSFFESMMNRAVCISGFKGYSRLANGTAIAGELEHGACITTDECSDERFQINMYIPQRRSKYLPILRPPRAKLERQPGRGLRNIENSLLRVLNERRARCLSHVIAAHCEL